MKSESIAPFLKWPGGKRWLLTKSEEIFPTKYKKYIEPFLGSGAVFFYLQPKNSVLSDNNVELIETYEAVKSDWKKVYHKLIIHQKIHSKDYYYKIRDRKPKSIYSRASRLIYLNRTCWNGLYRVNKNGKFNVPIGTKNNVILPTDDFERISKLLQKEDKK